MVRDLACEEEEAGSQAAEDGDEDVGPGLASPDGLEGETCPPVRGLGIQREAASFPAEVGDLASRTASAPAFA